MTGEFRPKAAQRPRPPDSGAAVKANLFTKGHHHRRTVNLHAITGENRDVSIQLHMRVEMIGALLNLDPASGVKLLRKQQSDHVAVPSNNSAKAAL